ncbi:hypothetical protein [Cohnella faecalis]|nr:hypothetical protein [Cohnella faecalis]
MTVGTSLERDIYEIGSHLASLARSAPHVEPASTFRDVAQPVQREYVRGATYHFERMKGIAAAFDSKLDDDELDFKP